MIIEGGLYFTASFPPSSAAPEASDGAVTKAHSGRDPVGEARFLSVYIAASCTRRMCIAQAGSRGHQESRISFWNMGLHRFMFRLVVQCIAHNFTQTLRLAHIIHYLHSSVSLLLRPFWLYSPFLLFGFFKSKVRRVFVKPD